MEHLGRRDRLSDIVTFGDILGFLERSSIRKDVAEVSQAAEADPATVYLTLALNNLRGGTYRIDIPYVYSYNQGISDIIVEITVDGAIVETHRVEPKDVGGGDGGTGSGTNQRVSAIYSDIIQFTAGASPVIGLQFRGQNANQEATIYKGAIMFERWQ